MVSTRWIPASINQCALNTREFYDPYLLEIHNDVLVGGEAFVNCHLFEGGYLILGKIILKNGTSIGAGSYITPGTCTGENSRVGMYTYLRRNTNTKDNETLITLPGMSMRQASKIMRTNRKEKLPY